MIKKKSIYIGVRVTPEEYEELQRKSKISKKSISQVVRDSIVEQKLIVVEGWAAFLKEYMNLIAEILRKDKHIEVMLKKILSDLSDRTLITPQNAYQAIEQLIITRNLMADSIRNNKKELSCIKNAIAQKLIRR